MAFETYKCERYVIYLQQHQESIIDIYNLIVKSPVSKSEIGRHLGYDYHQFHRRVKNQTFTIPEIIKILEFIK